MNGSDQVKQILYKYGKIAINILFWIILFILVWFLTRLFLFTAYKIPSDSMEPALNTGDYILVNKLIPGARLFNIFIAFNEEQPIIHRLPGKRNIKRNDIVVFNFPHPYSWSKIQMHIMKYYIKRCIGAPGDSLEIKNGYFQVNGSCDVIGNKISQMRLSNKNKEDFQHEVYHTFPYDSIINWNIKDFGPLYIPSSGDYITMNRKHYFLYRKLIEWELQKSLTYQEGKVYVEGHEIPTYQFKKNYYFMAGDKGEDSQDSRYWGLLPEEYIVGKAWMIWKSVDPYTGKWRKNRLLKKIS